MQNIVPIYIVLEVKKGAPSIDFEFSKISNEERVNLRDSWKKMKTTNVGKNQKIRTISGASSAMSDTPTTQPPTLPEENKGKKERIMPTQENCFGRRKYAEVVVETLRPKNVAEKPAGSVEPSGSSSSIAGPGLPDRAGSVEPVKPDKIVYFCGNPDIEKTTGILHFYRNRIGAPETEDDNCSMLCMIGVPAYLTCSDLINFVQPCDAISEMKIVRDSTPNFYMAIIKFKSYRSTMNFYARFNGREFSPFKEDRCNLMFVEKIETTTEESGGSLPRENWTELPTCAVCLEKLDDNIVTVLCNHTFHSHCLQQWNDTRCPVCRHQQTPEEIDTQKCSNCGKSRDLWMCLICGNIGCGRYVAAHAYHHFETTGHTFTIQVGGNLVWDYAGDNYVHRIIQNSSDGKLVEVQPGRNENDKQSDKLDEIQMEYSNMLSQQLDKQRTYFEDKIKAMEESMNNFRDGMMKEMNDLKIELTDAKAEIKKLTTNLQSTKSAKDSLEKKLNVANAKIVKLKEEISEEQQMSEMLRKDKDELMKQKDDLVWKNNTEIKDLREQLHDVMMHFDAKAKIEGGEMLTEEELQSASVELMQGTKEKNQHKKKGKRK